MVLPVNLKNIQDAYHNIKPYVRHTPLLMEERLKDLANCEVYLKPECLQITGSFKLRGAINKILSLTDSEKEKGVIATSSGNHAQGVAYAAKKLDTKATLILPENAPLIKIEGTKALGAEVILYGYNSAQRHEKLEEIVEQKFYTVIHSYDDPILIAGQGTVGYEIMEDIEGLDAIVVPLGGGGLLAGISIAVKEINPKIKVIGVEPKAVPRYSESRKLGRPVEVSIKDTIADGLVIPKPGENTFPIIANYVDEIITVNDEFIYKTLPEIIFKTKLVVEPSAVVGFAAALEGNLQLKKYEKVCFVLSGGNIDPGKLAQFIKNENTKHHC